MKIDRRCFLSLGVGAAAGTALSPLPWKLTDDLSIWTQMWPWTPVPADGAVSYVDSVSTLCPSGCGISVRKIDERPVKIEGRPGYPAGDGKACIMCMSGLQKVYSEIAVQSPLLREGERGQGKWRKISWQEAIETVSARLKTLRGTGETAKLAGIAGKNQGTVPRLIQRFLTAYGSPNFMYPASIADAYELAIKIMHGMDARVGFDFENAGYVISFGAGVLDGWGSSVRMFQNHSAWRDRGVKMVQVEPRLSSTAAKADQWIPVNPGTEGILALGIASAIVEAGLYKADFVNQFGFGFEDWIGSDGKTHKGFKSIVTGHFSPRTVAGITGVDGNRIVELAKEFAAAPQPLAICGRGAGHIPGGLHDVMAVHALNALVGGINAKGGVWTLPADPFIAWEAPALDAVAEKGVKTARIDGAGSEAYPMSRNLLSRLAGVINGAEGSPLEILLLAGGNPCYSIQDAQAFRKAMAKIPFIVSFASEMDETAEMADIILPHHGHLQGYEDLQTPFGMNKPMVALAKPIIPPKRQTQHVGDSIIQIAKAVGGSVAEAFPWANYEECLAKTYEKDWEALSGKGIVCQDAYQPPDWGQAFGTPSAKFVFMSETCKFEGDAAALVSPIAEKDPAYPVLLISYDSMRLSGGAVTETPFMLKTVSDGVLKGKEASVEINPKTGGKMGLENGCRATLTTPIGKGTVLVQFSDGIVPGVVAMPRGLGHFELDAYVGGKGLNVNEFIGPVEDPASGLDAAWGIKANLTIA